MNGSKLMTLCLSAAFALAGGLMVGCGPAKTNPDAGPVQTADTGPKTCDCNPACPAGMKCDTTCVGGMGVCVDLCPGGCKEGFEVCNETTKQCEPVKCNNGTETCGTGEQCVQFTQTESHCSCTPTFTDTKNQPHTDTCLDFGMICSMDTNNPVPSHCREPKQYEDCNDKSTCATDSHGKAMECAAFSTSSGKTVHMCVIPCTKNSECDGLQTACDSQMGNVCWFKFCVDFTTNAKITDAERAKFFAPCDMDGTGDGYCQPQPSSDPDGILGVCQLAGSAQVDGECNPADLRGDPTKTCVKNAYCLKAEGFDTTAKGICRASCNAAPGTKVPTLDCAANHCFDFSGATAAADKTRFGICMESCNLFGTGGCTGTDVLNNGYGCQPWSFTDPATAVCWPTTSTAAAAGATCTRFARGTDPRETCTSRLTCADVAASTAPADYKCIGYCDTTVCTDPKVACSSCQPAGAKCVQGDPANPAKVGFCVP